MKPTRLLVLSLVMALTVSVPSFSADTSLRRIRAGDYIDFRFHGATVGSP
jgi:hypothetical protein